MSKTLFYAYGYRDTKNWDCPYCETYSTCGMDLFVDESTKKHLANCPELEKVRQEEQHGK